MLRAVRVSGEGGGGLVQTRFGSAIVAMAATIVTIANVVEPHFVAVAVVVVVATKPQSPS